jgi:hypothetical protein
MHLAWAKGGGADLVSMDGEALVLRSTTPAPPGVRLDATLAAGDAVKIKSHGSHREEDGTFTVRARLLNARRELREKLASLVSADR